MDPTTDVLADQVRAKRIAIDNDLELLRLKAHSAARAADPRPNAAKWGRTALPVALGATALWLWSRRRRSVGSLQDLLVHEVLELYNMEHQQMASLASMAAAATNEDLAALLRRHTEETASQVERLGRVLRSIGAKPRRRKAEAVAALEDEGHRLLKRRADADVRDAWLIATAQRLEHLEIANYGTARSFAETLGYTYAAQLLQQTLEEEKVMDEQLTRLAERFVNVDSIR